MTKLEHLSLYVSVTIYSTNIFSIFFYVSICSINKTNVKETWELVKVLEKANDISRGNCLSHLTESAEPSALTSITSSLFTLFCN